MHSPTLSFHIQLNHRSMQIRGQNRRLMSLEVARSLFTTNRSRFVEEYVTRSRRKSFHHEQKSIRGRTCRDDIFFSSRFSRDIFYLNFRNFFILLSPKSSIFLSLLEISDGLSTPFLHPDNFSVRTDFRGTIVLQQRLRMQHRMSQLQPIHCSRWKRIRSHARKRYPVLLERNRSIKNEKKA